MAVTAQDRMGLGDATFKVNRPTEIRPALANQVLGIAKGYLGLVAIVEDDQLHVLAIGRPL